jgi:hypothetical protein
MGQTNFSGPVKSTGGLIVGSGGTTVTKVLKGTVSVNPASLNNATAADESITISGAAVGDAVILNPPTAGLTAGMLIVGAWVSATDTVKVRLYNSTGAPINEAAADWTYTLIRS